MKIGMTQQVLLARMAAVGLGVFLAVGVCLAPGVASNAGSEAVFAAIDANCQSVLTAGEKELNTPYHAYSTSTGGMSMGGAPLKTEVIYVGGTLYSQFQGKWTSTVLSMQDIKNMVEANRTKNMSATCQHLRDEAVNGEDAAVYSANTQSDRAKSEQTMWISKSHGLPLRVEIDLVSLRNGTKSHMSVRYDYNNVQKPAM